MSRVHRNNFRTTLNGSITNVATSITLNDSFAAISSGETLSLTIYGGGLYEIISIPFAGIGTAPTYTGISRGQEGTSAIAWADGSKVECRLSRDSVDTKQDSLSGTAVTSATAVAADLILFQDISNSNALRTETVQNIANLASNQKFVLIDTKTASASSSLDFTGLGDYSDIHFKINSLIPATISTTAFWVQTSSNNGSSYDNSAANYSWASRGYSSGGNTGETFNDSDTKIVLTGSRQLGNNAGNTINGDVHLYNAAGTGFFHALTQHISFFDTTGQINFQVGTGCRKDSSNAVNAIRFLMSTGNITSGTIYAYGIKKS